MWRLGLFLGGGAGPSPQLVLRMLIAKGSFNIDQIIVGLTPVCLNFRSSGTIQSVNIVAILTLVNVEPTCCDVEKILKIFLNTCKIVILKILKIIAKEL